ncbi:hypothetical protein [Streptomyces phaeochromogenes]|uniref:hypothetical protein n=1 Tax=Streptomyces phaeochromogenes TaxID=1923 RepID=UPI002DDB0BC0|nr:hypothetical protein [Streptomyces phaeochromogenes]WRZ30203.1 hypothetical protein OG931_21860 [Streptomyces phaeochromogenes]
MHDLTYAARPLAALPAAVREPSYAAQILTVAERLLQRDCTEPVDAWTLDDDLTTATDAIVATLPAVVAESAALLARAQLPPFTGISRGEYALRLHTAARELG